MTYFSTIPAEVFDALGVIGFGLYVINYALLTFQKVQSSEVKYFAINLLAASLVLLSLMSTFNLASALIQGFWIVISGLAIAIRVRGKTLSSFRHHDAPTPPAPTY